MNDDNNDGKDLITEQSAGKKLQPSWDNPPDLRDLKTDLTSSQSNHDSQVVKIQTWLDNLHITGGAKRKKTTGRSSMQPKLIRKQAEWRYAALSEPYLSTPNIFTLAPVTHEDADRAEQNSIVLNNQFNTQVNKVRFIDDYVRTAVDEGTVIVRVGWEANEETVMEEQEIFNFYPNNDPVGLKALRYYAEWQQSKPEDFLINAPSQFQQALRLTQQQGIPILPTLDRTEEIEVTKMTKNGPTLEVCDYNNLHVDPTCQGDLETAEFVVYSFESSKSELMKAGVYENLDDILVSTSTVLGEPDHTTDHTDGFNFKDEPRSKFVVYEYWGNWDINDDGTTVAIVAAWVGNTLIRLEENPYPDKKPPFVSAQYLPVRRSVYGEPDGALLKDNQDIIGAVTRGAIDSMARSANAQRGMRKDALDATNRRRYEKGLDYEFNPTVDPRQAMIEHSYPELPNSISTMINHQQTEADSMTGVRAFGATNSDAGSGTATADRGVLDAASKRESGILRRLSKGLTDIARKIVSMNAEFLSEQEVVRVTNDTFITVQRDDLGGKFDIALSISTAEEDNAKAQELAFMLQTMGNTMGLPMSQLVLAKIAKLRKMPELAQEIEDFTPEPDPVAQALQQLEVAKIQAEIRKINAGAELDLAKAGSEGAKASNLASDTDQKNLDYLEQESGVTHARNLQQDGEQARGNMALKILDAGLQASQATGGTNA